MDDTSCGRVNGERRFAPLPEAPAGNASAPQSWAIWLPASVAWYAVPSNLGPVTLRFGSYAEALVVANQAASRNVYAVPVRIDTL